MAARRASAVAVAAMCAGVAAAAVYEVGDKAGWTIMGNPNYGAWAASKKFQLGDTVGASSCLPSLLHPLPLSLSLSMLVARHCTSIFLHSHQNLGTNYSYLEQRRSSILLTSVQSVSYDFTGRYK
jgi:opacity protein-like surface antigen